MVDSEEPGAAACGGSADIKAGPCPTGLPTGGGAVADFRRRRRNRTRAAMPAPSTPAIQMIAPESDAAGVVAVAGWTTAASTAGLGAGAGRGFRMALFLAAFRGAGAACCSASFGFSGSGAFATVASSGPEDGLASLALHPPRRTAARAAATTNPASLILEP